MSSSPFFFKLAVRCSSEFSDRYVRSKVVMNCSDRPGDPDPATCAHTGLPPLLPVAWAHVGRGGRTNLL